MKPLKGDQQLRSVSLSYSVTLQALEPKSSPRRRRGLDATTDRGLTERSGEVFLLDILSHRMSVFAMLRQLTFAGEVNPSFEHRGISRELAALVREPPTRTTRRCRTSLLLRDDTAGRGQAGPATAKS